MSQDPLGNRRGGSATIVVSFQSQTVNVNFEWTVSQLFTKHAELVPPNNPSLLLPTIPIPDQRMSALRGDDVPARMVRVSGSAPHAAFVEMRGVRLQVQDVCLAL